MQPLRLGPPLSPRDGSPKLQLISADPGGPWNPDPRSHTTLINDDPPGKAPERRKRAWSLETSIWAPRRAWSDSRDFYDSAGVLEKAIEADWLRANLDGSIVKSLGKNATDADVESVKTALKAFSQPIYSIFDMYASLGSSTDIAHIQFNAYKKLLEDAKLIDTEPGRVSGSRWDELFVSLNASSASVEDDEFNHKKGINRQEFLELLVRATVLRFQPLIEQLGASVRRLLQVDILPSVTENLPMALQNANDFRLQNCYTEETDGVLRKHEAALTQIYQGYSTITTSAGGILTKKLLDINEWNELMADLELVTAIFTERDARMCFVWSRMRVVKESEAKSRKKLLQLGMEDFLEAIVRVATMKALPTDKDVEASGCADGGEFLLSLELGDPDEFDDFLQKNNPRNHRWRGKPLQPVHRAVDHLIAMIVRAFAGKPFGPHSLKLPADCIKKHVEKGGALAWRSAPRPESEPPSPT